MAKIINQKVVRGYSLLYEYIFVLLKALYSYTVTPDFVHFLRFGVQIQPQLSKILFLITKQTKFHDTLILSHLDFFIKDTLITKTFWH